VERTEDAGRFFHWDLGITASGSGGKERRKSERIAVRKGRYWETAWWVVEGEVCTAGVFIL